MNCCSVTIQSRRSDFISSDMNVGPSAVSVFTQKEHSFANTRCIGNMSEVIHG